MGGDRITTAEAFDGDLASFLADYTYQPALTGRLDELANSNLTQQTVNEIVLWKVNRYVSVSTGPADGT